MIELSTGLNKFYKKKEKYWKLFFQLPCEREIYTNMRSFDARKYMKDSLGFLFYQ